MGVIRYGLGKVLSTISGMPAAWATSATARISSVSRRGIAHRLGIDGAGLRGDGGAEVFGIAAVDEAHVDAQVRQRLREEIVRAAVEARAGDDLLARAREIGDRQEDGRLAGCGRQRRHTALKGRDALLEDILSSDS